MHPARTTLAAPHRPVWQVAPRGIVAQVTPPAATGDTGETTTAVVTATTAPAGEGTETRANPDETAAFRARAETAERELNTIKASQADADRKAAEKRGEWESLAGSEKARADKEAADRESVTAERDALRAALIARQDADVKALPEELRGLIPTADEASLVVRGEKIAAALKAAEKLGGARVVARGNGADPKPAGQATETEAFDAWARGRAPTPLRRVAA